MTGEEDFPRNTPPQVASSYIRLYGQSETLAPPENRLERAILPDDTEQCLDVCGLRPDELEAVGYTLRSILQRRAELSADAFAKHCAFLRAYADSQRVASSPHNTSSPSTARKQQGVTPSRAAPAVVGAQTALVGFTLTDSVRTLSKATYTEGKVFYEQLKKFELNGVVTDRRSLVDKTVATILIFDWLARGFLTHTTRDAWVHWPADLFWERLRKTCPNPEQTPHSNAPLAVLYASVSLNYDVHDQESFHAYCALVLEYYEDTPHPVRDEKGAVEVLIKNLERANCPEAASTATLTLSRLLKEDLRPTTVQGYIDRISFLNVTAQSTVHAAMEWGATLDEQQASCGDAAVDADSDIEDADAESEYADAESDYIDSEIGASDCESDESEPTD
jgi:hypothetical protein